MRLFSSGLVLLLVGCHAKTASHVAPTSNEPTFLYRFVDHAAEAQVEGDLDRGFATLAHPLISPSPLPNGVDGAFPRAMQVAFAEPNLDRLLGKRTPVAKTLGKQHIDLEWNATQGVYEARESLFLPDGVAMYFTLPPMGAARFTAQVGGLDAAQLVVEDSAGSHTFTAPAQAWLPISFDLPAHAAPTSITLRHAGKGPLFVGAPIVRASDLPKHPNILFVLIDTLRADALPAMSGLSAYAKSGARFSTAITTATWTRPSLIGMFGGDVPSRLGHAAEEMIPTDRERRRFRALRPALMPRRLEALGYETRAIANNFFLLGFPRIGLDLGIDEVTDVRHPLLDSPAIAAEAIRVLDAPRNGPLFLYLHFDAPHWPYTPPPAALARARNLTLPGLDAQRDPEIRRYLGEAAYADMALSDVLAALEKSGHDQDTIVVVLGDHGEVFDPAHSYEVDALGFPTVHHHGWTAYDEILRVPLVIAWAGHIVPRVVDVQTSFVDLAPTLEELVGLAPTPSTSPTAGHSLANALLSKDAWPLTARPAFVEGQDVRALREDGWLYIARSDGRLHIGASHFTRSEELYALADDPLQHRDRLDDIAQLTKMRARFADLTPTLPEFAEPVLHLAMAESTQLHRLTVTLRSAGSLWVRGIERGRAQARADKAGSMLEVELDGGGRVELGSDPQDAAIDVTARRDGIPVPLLVGPMALPLLGPVRDTITIDAAHLAWLDAARPPYFGDEGDVLVWRDPVATQSTARATKAADSEVATIMQRWGYAQPTKKR